MKAAKINELVYTNENCIGCNKCITSCGIINANKVNLTPDGYRVDVNSANCINCGACFDTCQHKARVYRDDTDLFFEDLKKGESITLLLAPAFVANYPNEYQRILGGLKKMGVKRIISVSFGADITTWGYVNFLSQSGLEGAISQPCPAVVNYIEHYTPQLIPMLVPIHSPLMCAAIYVKKYMGITDKLAFISPCIAKKAEINDPNTHNFISYNVTFNRLMEYVRENNIDGPPAKDEIEHGGGLVYPMPGGLKENVHWFCGEDAFVRQIEGETAAYKFLDKYQQTVANKEKLPFLVDVLNCEMGCIYGTGIEEEKLQTEAALYEIHSLKVKNKNQNVSSESPWDKTANPEQRLQRLNKQFENLNINDFRRSYTDKSSLSEILQPTEEEKEIIFQALKKITDEDRNINCSSCGFDTCAEMVVAIHNKCSHLENCVYYMKKLIEDEKHHIEQLSSEIENKNEAILSSLKYATKIQTNLLPKDDVFSASFADYAVLWKPKDVVGGDVYWLKNFSEGTVLCVCDCTGHGTSGAMITMLVASIFNATIKESNCKDTANIIYMLDKALDSVLHTHSDDEIKDGCDLAVLFIANNGEVKFSSGNTNVFACDGQKVEKMRGQRLFVGEGKIENKEAVKVKTIEPNPNNRFYISSDGLFDQCGSEDIRLPFGHRPFSKIILKYHNHPLTEVTQKVWSEFEEFRMNEARRDDVQLVCFQPKFGK